MTTRSLALTTLLLLALIPSGCAKEEGSDRDEETFYSSSSEGEPENIVFIEPVPGEEEEPAREERRGNDDPTSGTGWKQTDVDNPRESSGSQSSNRGSSGGGRWLVTRRGEEMRVEMDGTTVVLPADMLEPGTKLRAVAAEAPPGIPAGDILGTPFTIELDGWKEGGGGFLGQIERPTDNGGAFDFVEYYPAGHDLAGDLGYAGAMEDNGVMRQETYFVPPARLCAVRVRQQ